MLQALAESGGFLAELDLETPNGRKDRDPRNSYVWNVARELVRQHSQDRKVSGSVGPAAKAYGFGRQLKRYLDGASKHVNIKAFEQRVRECAFSKWDLEVPAVKEYTSPIAASAH